MSIESVMPSNHLILCRPLLLLTLIFPSIRVFPKSRFFALGGQSAKSLQSCPTLCDPIDGSQPGSPVPGILQARTLEPGDLPYPGIEPRCLWGHPPAGRGAGGPNLLRTVPGQASSRGEAKDSALLSSRDAGLLEPPESKLSLLLLLSHFSRVRLCATP